MVQLRPDLDEQPFVEQVLRHWEEGGYRLVYLENEGDVVAVAGSRLTERLSRGRSLYVDDLVTDEDRRSQGHGTRLLAWLASEARREGCQRLDLGSGLERERAHRFYEREGLDPTALHVSFEL